MMEFKYSLNNQTLIQQIKNRKGRLIVTSGGFDPIHKGHIECIESSVNMKKEGDVFVVIVNGDKFLERKKGKPFMNHSERLKIVSSLKGVDYVVGWEDETQNVVGAIKILKPDIFTKGGDRSSPESVPEYEICKEIGCEVIFGAGGFQKIQSSTNLLNKAAHEYNALHNLTYKNNDCFELNDRTWGYEKIIFEKPSIAKILTVFSNKEHKGYSAKEVSLLVLSGNLKLELKADREKTDIFLSAGEKYTIPKNFNYKYLGWLSTVKLLEVS